uniref:M28 family peptidase n=1 Tax=Empedobacter sp. TaxID=1927715 RepID=UPI0028B1B6E1
MKQFLFAITLVATLVSCNSTKPISQEKYQKSLVKYTDKISEAELKKQLYIIAGTDMEGRNAGSEGEIKAGNYISNYYKELGINGPNNNYFQIIPAGTFSRVKGQMRNVMGFIKGSEKPEEIVVISAHYDHEGIKDGELYAGADDDGSGTVAVMEIGRIFREAEKKGIRPKRSVLLLHVSGEEKGLLGSKYYSEHPIF